MLDSDFSFSVVSSGFISTFWLSLSARTVICSSTSSLISRSTSTLITYLSLSTIFERASRTRSLILFSTISFCAKYPDAWPIKSPAKENSASFIVIDLNDCLIKYSSVCIFNPHSLLLTAPYHDVADLRK